MGCASASSIRWRPLVLDFYCPSCKLVVEVHGAVHEQQAEYDQARTEQLNAYGYTVIRFRNQEVFTVLPAVWSVFWRPLRKPERSGSGPGAAAGTTRGRTQRNGAGAGAARAPGAAGGGAAGRPVRLARARRAR